MFKCEYCNKQIKSKAHYGQCKLYREALYEKLRPTIELYQLGYSANEIAKRVGSNATTVISFIRKNGINTRTVGDSANQARAKNKRVATNVKLYGLPHNFCGGHPSRKKWETRLLTEEGIINVFQRPEVKEKIKRTILEKYDVEYPSLITTNRGKNVYSSIHREVVLFLQTLGIGVEIEKKLSRSDGFYYAYDISISNTNKLIEVYGDYWHGNPLLHKETDLILKGSSKEVLVRDKWDADRTKEQHARTRGYDLLIVWEYDWKNNREDVERIISSYATS